MKPNQKSTANDKSIEIVAYQPKYQTAFKALNKEWIEKYFKMEESDYQSLDNPQTHILDPGGTILVALYGEEVAGVCALIKMDHPTYQFELAKMAVSSNYQGKGIGSLLGKAVVDKARTLGAKVIYLESNTSLTPAINLYHKLGFKKIEGSPSPYERCDIQMELYL